MTPEDARRSADGGATAVMVPNHGGRDLAFRDIDAPLIRRVPGWPR